MQDLEKTSAERKTLVLDNYVFSFDSNLKHETYSCHSYSGIVFHYGGYKYDVVNNYLMGFRLLINGKMGEAKDIPFKPATFGFLPDDIEVRIMNKEEVEYLGLLQNIVKNGSTRGDRTGVGTKGVFGTQLRFSLENNKVPMLTTKKMFVKGVVEELLFFLRGEVDTKLLEAKGVNIWKGNTSKEFLEKRDLGWLPEGHMGKGYGFQWRHFGGDFNLDNPYQVDIDNEGTDQLANVIKTLKTNPNDRRIIMSAWNPADLHHMALPPCHMMVQFYVDNGKLSAQFYMRSIDTFLGLPFNLLSYAILTRIVAATVGMEAKELIFVGGDTHLYLNHLEQVQEQISRIPFDFPTMKITKTLSTVADIEALQLSDFVFEGYQSHPAIKAEMAV